ncbi:MAG: NusG domain II-containing protein [Treponema sp.]|jgi:hypothetical protein|nr:NusG domain II-containing protein [Treponema sp.]
MKFSSFHIKIPDLIIILFSIALTGFSAYISYLKPQNNVHVLIRSNEREWTFPLDADESVAVSGPLGDTIIQIHDKKTWVVSSPCENQTCVIAGKLYRAGAWSVCLPNNVLLLIEGNDDEGNDVDAITW